VMSWLLDPPPLLRLLHIASSCLLLLIHIYFLLCGRES
jgi:hypothetical protein